ncbi:hypothetical protein L3Q82_013726 [Scortum barcoo]|uniref:Uncharacterized protein n=1 Tax=Scortum barcoo TaxID=214431 RepID=A0ACB8W148_9TELE|nr:hypothetical protein L3Q82_013726 [Scortum barcoo]
MKASLQTKWLAHLPTGDRKWNQEPLVQDFMERWSALFREKEVGVLMMLLIILISHPMSVEYPLYLFMFQINAEFLRLVALPLEQTFLAQLDNYSDQLIHIIQAKGGATREKTANIIKTLDQADDIHLQRECVLNALIIFLGEDADDLIREYVVSFNMHQLIFSNKQ